MRIRLGFRKQKVEVGAFSGTVFCGCRYLNGDLFEECDFHIEEHGRGRHHNNEGAYVFTYPNAKIE